MKNTSCRQILLQKILLLLPLVATLSGCVSIVSYKEPKSGPTARVRFVSDTSNVITTIREYDSTNCDNEKEMMRLRKGFLLRSDPRTLGMPLNNYHENAAKEFLVTAGVPHVYMFTHANISSSGSYVITKSYAVILYQKFEKDKDYELSYKENRSKPYVEVSEIKTDSNGVSKKIFVQRVTSRLHSEFSNACMNAFKKKRFW